MTQDSSLSIVVEYLKGSHVRVIVLGFSYESGTVLLLRRKLSWPTLICSEVFSILFSCLDLFALLAFTLRVTPLSLLLLLFRSISRDALQRFVCILIRCSFELVLLLMLKPEDPPCQA